MTGSPHSGGIDYGQLMHAAMRRLIQSVLERVARDGLPGEHHFFIAFDTTADGVEMADWLRERYPEEMTIVIQNWFDGLEVSDHGFEITLNFGNAPERLAIPFDALRTFVDPSVEFGLRFDTPAHEAEVASLDTEEAPHAHIEDDDDDAPRKDAEIVSLDKFRK